MLDGVDVPFVGVRRVAIRAVTAFAVRRPDAEFIGRGDGGHEGCGHDRLQQPGCLWAFRNEIPGAYLPNNSNRLGGLERVSRSSYEVLVNWHTARKGRLKRPFG